MKYSYEELIHFAESCICVFCFEKITLIDERTQECTHCGMPMIVPEQICDIQCYACEQMNPLPEPLDAGVFCKKCGAEI